MPVELTVNLSPAETAKLPDLLFREALSLKKRAIYQGVDKSRKTTAERLNRSRFASRVIRSHVKAWKAAHGNILPREQQRADVPATEGADRKAADVVIVFPPILSGKSAHALNGSMEEVISRRDVWRNHRRFLRRYLRLTGWSGELRSNLPKRSKYQLNRQSAVAASAFGESPISLTGVGAILLDRPSSSDLEDMKRAGAIVVPNIQLSLVEPDDSATNMSATELRSGDIWHLQHINAKAAYELGLNGKGIRIGVLDTGIDPKHPEFLGKSIKFMAFLPPDGNTLETKAKDFGVHGTHVSAVAAGKHVGVARGASLAVAAVLTERDELGRSVGYLAQILRGLNWLINDAGEEVGVLNASLGITGYRADFYNPITVARSIDQLTLVAAIGNNGRKGPNQHCSPGNYDVTLGIGATDKDDSVADFSDWGEVTQHNGLKKPDLSAPGVEIVGAIPGGKYASMSGTSMASPIVAGVIALLLQRDPTLRDNALALKKRIENLTTRVAGWNADRGGIGRVDLSHI